MHRHEQQPCGRHVAPDPSCGGDAVAGAQLDVHHHDVGQQPPGQVVGLGLRPCLTDQLDLGAGLGEEPEPGPHQRVVVDDQDAHGHGNVLHGNTARAEAAGGTRTGDDVAADLCGTDRHRRQTDAATVRCHRSGADAVVDDVDHQSVRPGVEADVTAAGAGMADDVRHRFGDDAIDRRLRGGGTSRRSASWTTIWRPSACVPISSARTRSAAARSIRSSTAGRRPSISRRTSSSTTATSPLTESSISLARVGCSTITVRRVDLQADRREAAADSVVQLGADPSSLAVGGRDDEVQ